MGAGKSAKVKTKKTPDGRPPYFLNEEQWKEMDYLMSIQCTQNEIAAFFSISVDALSDLVWRDKGISYTDYRKDKAALGLASLRRSMFKNANAGNVTMQIWLSKNLLGYTDKVEQDVRHTGMVEHKGFTDEQMNVLLEDQEALEMSRNLAMKMIDVTPKKETPNGQDQEGDPQG